MNQSLESRAYQKAFERVKSWTDSNLQSVWDAASSSYAKPQDGWGTYIENSWVVLPWDEWMEIIYSEMAYRHLPYRGIYERI